MGTEMIAERRRVEAVVETLAAMHREGESLGELAHDARNMVTALSLYCDLLEEPGVLAPSHRHYGNELRLLAEASRRLVEKLSLLDGREPEGPERTVSDRQGRLFADVAGQFPGDGLQRQVLEGGLIDDFRKELLGSRELLAAIAGPRISLRVTAEGGGWPIQMSSENLIRMLVNLVKNSAESISGTGVIDLRLKEERGQDSAINSLVLWIEDTGCGIPAELLEKVFEPGFTTRGTVREAGWTTGHRGLGLSITRSIVEAAGGRVCAEQRQCGGSRFRIELPVHIE